MFYMVNDDGTVDRVAANDVANLSGEPDHVWPAVMTAPAPESPSIVS